MAYSFRPSDETVAHGLRRIACDQIDAGLAEVDDDNLPMAERIHQLRKRCKKLRGLIRLVRPVFDAYSDENAAFRDASRSLSDLRDAGALVETCDALAAHYKGVLDEAALAPLRKRLVAETDAVQEEPDLADRVAKARDELSAARQRAREWTFDETGWAAVCGGLEKTFGRARKAMAEARRKPSEATMHEWRKRVKYHRYHARLLSRMDATLMSGHVEAVTTLSDVLGDHHDLHVLETRLGGLDLQSTPEAREATLGLLRERRDSLQDRAFILGQCLLTETPENLATRWRPLWEAWREPAR